MQYVKLTRDILYCLMEQGYTIIRSASPLSSDNPSWFPDKISVEEHLLWEDKQFGKHDFGFEGTHVLIIVDALEELADEDLIGEVWI